MCIGCSKVYWPGDRVRAVQPIAMSAPGYEATARRFAQCDQARGRLDG